MIYTYISRPIVWFFSTVEVTQNRPNFYTQLFVCGEISRWVIFDISHLQNGYVSRKSWWLSRRQWKNDAGGCLNFHQTTAGQLVMLLPFYRCPVYDCSVSFTICKCFVIALIYYLLPCISTCCNYVFASPFTVVARECLLRATNESDTMLFTVKSEFTG